jgi:uncharacterized membrane protein YbaN (DUF454 family)
MLVSKVFTAALDEDKTLSVPLVSFKASIALTLAHTLPVCATKVSAFITSAVAAMMIPFTEVMFNVFMVFCVCFMKQRKPQNTG